MFIGVFLLVFYESDLYSSVNGFVTRKYFLRVLK